VTFSVNTYDKNNVGTHTVTVTIALSSSYPGITTTQTFSLTLLDPCTQIAITPITNWYLLSSTV